ncbi:hypothetical protein ACFLSJ_09040, partial [Verrucomicrobiota bacterium]
MGNTPTRAIPAAAVLRTFVLPAGLAAVVVLSSGCASPDADLSSRLAAAGELTLDLPEGQVSGPLSLEAALQRAAACSDEIADLAAAVRVAERRKQAA